MLNASVEARLRGIIAGMALVDGQSFGLDDELAGSGVDSLSMLRAVARIESEFGITIPDGEFARLRTLRGLVSVVEARVLKPGPTAAPPTAPQPPGGPMR
jgi:acyl carrier protein